LNNPFPLSQLKPKYDWINYNEPEEHLDKLVKTILNLKNINKSSIIAGVSYKEVSTLERFKIYNTKEFLQNPELQENAFTALCKVNKWILRKDIRRSVGKTINGIKITESGILAAAHLSGAGNVKKFLRSNGANRFFDAYGSSIQFYLKKFSGYDVSSIKPDKNASV
jgi:hypothetical protein